ncbi:hypothetical protein Tco_0268367 [Tanacetum coccineum]
MDDMIKEKLALKELVDSLEQNLSKQIKEKECLLHTFTNFKNESKEKEDKYMENEIELEKKIKEFDSILFKVGQSAQTMLMLTKPQAFYDNIHKQAPGYQNLFHLKKAQRIKPTLYDGIVMSNKHVAMPVIKDEETLILEEESRLKMSEKAKDPEFINKNISHKPIDYEKLNTLTEDFGKCFTPQQELSAEQAFWLRMSDLTSKPSDALPVKIEAPKELPKISLVENVKMDFCDLETKNVELEHSVAKMILENERLCNEINHEQADILRGIVKQAKAKQPEDLTGHVFTEVGLKWKPTGKTFTIVGNSCPLTSFTSANVVPPKKTTSHSVETQKPELKVYSRKPKNVKNVGSSKKAKIVESKNANHSEPNHTWGSNATDIPSSSFLVMTVRFGNDHIARIMGYGDYQLGNVTISRVLLQASLKDGLARGISRLKFQKDHLCSTCALGKSKKSSHQPKAEDTNQEKLYLLYVDLCGPIRVSSINRKRDDWDHLFQPMFDEYFTPLPISVTPVQEVAALRAVVLVDSPMSTSIDQDAPSSSTPSAQERHNSIISQGLKNH